MWFRENFDHARQQNKLSGAFTAKVIQYLQINLCTGAYTVYFVDTDLRAAQQATLYHGQNKLLCIMVRTSYSVSWSEQATLYHGVSHFYSSSSANGGARFITECMWFRENFDHARQQNKLSGAFTAKVIQYFI
jgi:hypothetical protein